VEFLCHSVKELKGLFAQLQPPPRPLRSLVGERFKSLLLEGGQAVATVAAYIDLNPVGAALCADSKDYPYCGYAAPICLASDMSQ
jgi:putative transposase